MTDQQKQITDAFMKDFEDLLRKYNASFDFNKYDYYGGSPEIDFNVIYDEEGNTLRPYINFRLPNCINPND